MAGLGERWQVEVVMSLRLGDVGGALERHDLSAVGIAQRDDRVLVLLRPADRFTVSHPLIVCGGLVAPPRSVRHPAAPLRLDETGGLADRRNGLYSCRSCSCG